MLGTSFSSTSAGDPATCATARLDANFPGERMASIHPTLEAKGRAPFLGGFQTWGRSLDQNSWFINGNSWFINGESLLKKNSGWPLGLCPLIGDIPSGKLLHSYGKPPFLMGKSTISMVIFNSYVTNYQRVSPHLRKPHGRWWKHHGNDSRSWPSTSPPTVKRTQFGGSGGETGKKNGQKHRKLAESMGKPWENHGKTMGKPWENHGKTMGKPWEIWKNSGKVVVYPRKTGI